MNFLSDFIGKDPSANTSTVIVLLSIFLLFIIMSAFFFDYQKNNKNLIKINMLERAIKDLIEEFRSQELTYQNRKKSSRIINILLRNLI